MSYPRKVQEIEHAKRVKAQYPHMAMTTIAKIVGVASSTLYKSHWYQTTIRKSAHSTPTIQPSLKSAKPEVNKLSQEVGEIVDLLRLVTSVQARVLTKLEDVYEQV